MRRRIKIQNKYVVNSRLKSPSSVSLYDRKEVVPEPCTGDSETYDLQSESELLELLCKCPPRLNEDDSQTCRMKLRIMSAPTSVTRDYWKPAIDDYRILIKPTEDRHFMGSSIHQFLNYRRLSSPGNLSET